MEHDTVGPPLSPLAGGRTCLCCLRLHWKSAKGALNVLFAREDPQVCGGEGERGMEPAGRSHGAATLPCEGPAQPRASLRVPSLQELVLRRGMRGP